MKAKRLLIITGASLLIACHAVSERRQPPTQVVYRFDDHRYLELTGFNCEGALWYTDTRKGIHTEVTSQFYRVFTRKYVHPSERYISITYWDVSGFIISKDYGKTWQNARFSPGGGADPYGKKIPERKDSFGITFVAGENTNPLYQDVVSFTVVNDQGFMLTKWGDLYISSKPFDDPRLQPGGGGIPYTYKDVYGEQQHDRLMPGTSGLNWGEEYTSWNSVDSPDHWSTDAHKPNWQGIPNKVPEVKNYTGWDHMRCDPDLGLAKKDE
ncbi:hypothetical protein EYW98_17450 [Escherichia coli]|nr:hypothetical protein [Escherichia coli]EGO8379640.1 hypothetical protein [Escherichia coli]